MTLPTRSRPPYLLISLLFLIMLLEFSILIKTPSGDRQWYGELAILPGVKVMSDHTVAVPYVRDWHLTETGSTSPRYLARTYDTNNLERVWFFEEPFPDFDALGHSFFSFDFKGQEPVVISVEARKEIDEAHFSPYQGAFRQYELIYVWSTEEDEVGRFVVGREKPLLMYELQIPKEMAQKLFIEVARRSAYTESHPQFYNTFVDNCTSTLADVANDIAPGTIPWTWARVFTGYADDYLIEHGFIANSSIAKANVLEVAQKSSNSELSTALRKQVLGN